MHGKMIFCTIGLIAALALSSPRICLAASTLTVTPSGDGVFLLQGLAVESAGSMDITITYDGGALGNPRVLPGELISGALTAVNTGTAGTVRIAIIRTSAIKGSGIIATLRFDRKGDAAGTIRALTARLSTLDGKMLPVQLRVEAPVTRPDLANQPAREGDKTETALSTAPASIALVAPAHDSVTGVVTGLTAEGGRTVEGTAEARTTEPDAGPAGEPKQEEALLAAEILILKSVLDRFREYAGERTPQAFIVLFEQSGAGGFSQTLSPFLADGKSVLEVVFVAAPGDTRVADMAATGARLLSLKQDPDDPLTWLVQLRPKSGVLQASLTVPLETFVIVFPLAVAPKVKIDLDRSGTVTPADFSLFLKKRSSFDLNNDGKRDYRDDYLFTANYLAATGSKPLSTKKNGVSAPGAAPQLPPAER